MPTDPLTKTLLTEYLRISENLQKGVSLGPDVMANFLGQTGILLAHLVDSQWSETALNEKVESILENRCSHCENTAFIQMIKEGRINHPALPAAPSASGEAPKDGEKLTWLYVVKNYGRTLIWGVVIVFVTLILAGQTPAIERMFNRVAPATAETAAGETAH